MSETKSMLDQVRQQYATVAEQGLSSRLEGVRAVAEAFGYSPEELAAIPAEANMGLSCGNPLATARLRAGETVVDLGCGGGLDVLLAARKVGPQGRAIGIDMTQEMIALARRNAEQAAQAAGGHDVAPTEFHLATIDQLPLPDAAADCIISNCVINLAPDKAAVLREAFRVLKPGGRLAVSDIALKEELPAEIRDSLPAYIGCIAGAILIDEYRRLLRESGFFAVEVLDTGADLNAYAKAENAACCVPSAGSEAPTAAGLEIVTPASCCTTDASPAPGIHQQLTDLLHRYDVNQYAASVRVLAVKPPAGASGAAQH